jgi:hypothetical protein
VLVRVGCRTGLGDAGFSEMNGSWVAPHDVVVGAVGASTAYAGAVTGEHLRGGPAVQLHQVAFRAVSPAGYGRNDAGTGALVRYTAAPQAWAVKSTQLAWLWRAPCHSDKLPSLRRSTDRLLYGWSLLLIAAELGRNPW